MGSLRRLWLYAQSGPGRLYERPSLPPEINVASPYLQHRIRQLEARIDAELELLRVAIASDATAAASFASWARERERICAAHPSGWVPQSPIQRIGAAAAEAPPTDETITFAAGPASQDQLALRPGAGWLAAVRLDILPRDTNAADNALRRDGQAADLHVRLQLAVEHEGQRRTLRLAYADASDSVPVYRNGHARIGIENDWHVPKNPATLPLTSVWFLAAPFRLAEDDLVWITLPENRLARMRLSVSALRPADIRQACAPSVRPDRGGGTRIIAGAARVLPPVHCRRRAELRSRLAT